MAIQSQIFLMTGGRTFSSTKHIATKQHMAVFMHYQVSTGGDAWYQLNVDEFELINNSAVIRRSFDSSEFDTLELRVGDTPDEVLTSPDDISTIVDIAAEIVIVAGIADEVKIVADNMGAVLIVAGGMAYVKTVADDLSLPYSHIKHAMENALAATQSATEALASENKAYQWAENPEDVPVEEIGGVDKYSAHHWANKAELFAKPLTLIGEWNPSIMGAEYPTGTFEDGYFWIIAGVPVGGYTFVNGDLAGKTGFNGDWMIWDGTGWLLTPTQLDASSFYRRDGSLPMTEHVECGTQKVVDMADATDPQDGTTLSQVNAKFALGTYPL